MRQPRRRTRSQFQTIPAPTGGIVENFPIANPNPNGAEVVRNFLPTQRGLLVRGGISRAALIGGAVKTLFSYIKPSSPAFFAASTNAIYDISSLTPGSEASQVVSGLASGDFSTQQVGTAGGDFLVSVNGTDYAQLYDGGAWQPIADEAVNNLAYDALTTNFAVGETVTGGTSGASAEILGVLRTNATTGTLKIGAVTSGPFGDNEAITSAGGAAVVNGTVAAASSIAITGVATTALSHVWLFKSRLFFVQKNTLTAWYMPVAAIGGAASDISLAGIFRRGGSLLMGGTWSFDSGDGIDDRCVFISTEGEVAIYQGSDPSDTTQWAIVGRYDIGKPLGKRATMQAGGDLLIATVDGIVPLSQVVQKDPAALSLAAVTRPIEITWAGQVSDGATDYELIKWTDENIGMVVAPASTAMLTVNLQTGAWASQGGWYGTCCALYLGNAFVGRADGQIYKLNDTGADDGNAFTAQYCHSFFDLGDAATYKVAQLVRGAFFANNDFAPRFGMAFDYDVTFGVAPDAAARPPSGGMIWGIDNWGEKEWGGVMLGPVSATTTEWRTVTGAGYALAPTVQITSGGAERLSVELVRVDVAFETGERVV